MKLNDDEIVFISRAQKMRSRGRKLEIFYAVILGYLLVHWIYLSVIAEQLQPHSNMTIVMLVCLVLRLPLLSGSASIHEGKLIDFLELKLKENAEDPEG
jgi:hypothetical protein